MNREKIESFYTKWQLTLPHRIAGYIYDENKKLFTPRFVFSKFKTLIKKFLKDQLLESEKIILIPGIRGIGKTTLLSHLYAIEKFLKPEDKDILERIGTLDERIYLDVSQLYAEQISLQDFFNFYEELKEFHFEKPEKKILILLDEVHFDERWDVFLKNLYDRTKGHKDILVIATGSSAIHINMVTDLKRRVDLWRILPMKFNEYLILKYNKSFIQRDYSENLNKILFYSSNAKEVYEHLKTEEKRIWRYFINEIPKDALKDFFEMGSFPSVLKMENKLKALEQIKSVIDGMIVKDILNIKRFESQTIAKIHSLLYALAQSDLINYNTLQTTLKIQSAETLEKLMEVLIMCEILVKVPTYRESYKSTRKTPKFLFITPSLRSAILNYHYPSNIEGKKLEDYFALIYEEELKEHHVFGKSILSYDLAEGGADFILTLKDKSNIVIEVGFHKETIKQVEKTMKKVKKPRYGLVIGSNTLELIENSIVKVPLRFLMLI